MRTIPVLAFTTLALVLGACSGPRRLPGDDQPTLSSLSQRAVKVQPDEGPSGAEEQTIAAYRRFLEVAPEVPQRAEAMRRLGDLEMDRADRNAAAGAGSAPDYRAAIERYQEFLKAYPDGARNDRVLYQLARAQEQGGDLEAALKTLTTLVTHYPGTLHADEAQFRRGELLFATGDYRQAEAAYAAVLESTRYRAALADAPRSPFRERALYMQGWAQFKQGRLEDALQSHFAVLDMELGGLTPAAREEADLAAIPALKRAERELVEDTFRVVSISLAQLQGADSVPRYITTPLRAGYEFRVYQQLGELYLRQDRIKDAADAFAGFVRRQPLHEQAPLLQARVIEIYEKNGFDTLALQAKREHVQRYGADGDFRRANPGGWKRAQPLVRAHLAELARHHHALAQKSHDAADVDEAVHWYRMLLQDFPDAPDAPAQRFLLAEMLFESHRYAQAVPEYEAVAYAPGPAPQGGDAGYAALLALAELEKAAPEGEPRVALQRQAVAGALRFAQAYPGDARTAAVLAHAAEQLLALGDGPRAVAVARQALALQPLPAAAPRRTAWNVIALQAFDQGAYAEAEHAYGEVLALTPQGDAGRDGVVERLAASAYKQGEQARTAGDARAAVGHFARVVSLGGLGARAAVRASAQFDAAAALIGLKDWQGAATVLEDFRREQPGHPLQSEVAPRLALVYLELGQAPQAATEFERVASQSQDPALARAAAWQAAELRGQAADGTPPHSPPRALAIQAYERYLQQYPQPLEPAVEARWRLAALEREDGQGAQATAWLRAVQQADLAAGEARTPRTRTRAGQAALALAEPLFDDYRKVRLAEPLQKQLRLKKAKMEDVLHAYAAAAEVGVAEVTTAATFRTAALYQDFGRALLDSARPARLSKAELEQYNVLLEEQAFPFEEKAIELHESNARRAAAGLYDTWVQASYAELARLKPVRYGKSERGNAALPSELSAIDVALQSVPAPAAPQRAALLNQRGIAERRLGHFDAARSAYEQAMVLDDRDAAPVLNLAILHDLYRGDAAAALPLYQHALELSPGDAPALGKWLAELKNRKPAAVPPPAAVAATKDPA